MSSGRHLGERSAAERHHVAGGVERFESQRAQGAAAAVAHGRTAQAQHDLRRAGVERGGDQLAAAVAVGAQRVGRRGLHVRQPGGLRGFDHCGGPAEGVLADRPGRADRGQDGAHDCVQPLLVAGGDGRLEGPFAAVGHRKLDGLGVGIDAQGAFGDGGGGFGGGEGALEFVRGDENAHGSILPVPAAGPTPGLRRQAVAAGSNVAATQIRPGLQRATVERQRTGGPVSQYGHVRPASGRGRAAAGPAR